MAKANPELDKLTEEVSEVETVVDSAVTLIEGLAQMIRDSKDDPAALTALADRLDSKKKKLAEAVTANTEPTE